MDGVAPDTQKRIFKAGENRNDEDDADRATRAVHTAFGLDK